MLAQPPPRERKPKAVEAIWTFLKSPKSDKLCAKNLGEFAGRWPKSMQNHWCPHSRLLDEG